MQLRGASPLATHYQALGVSPDAEAEVIQAAYRALMRKYHPDTNGGAYSDARAKRINAAYATLSDPGARAAYDAELRAAQVAPRPEATGPGAPPRGPKPRRPTPSGPADGFGPATPVRKPAPAMGWRLTALATVALAAAGFATGRALTSTSAPAVAGPAPGQPAPPPQAAPAPRAARAARASSAVAAVAAVVSGKIVPRWRPDCSAGDLVVDIQVNLSPTGSLLGMRLAGGSGDPARLPAAEERARLAIINAAPFSALPPERYGQWRAFIVRFDTRDVCAGRSGPG